MLLALFMCALMACTFMYGGFKVCLKSFENSLNFQDLKCSLQSHKALLSLVLTEV